MVPEDRAGAPRETGRCSLDDRVRLGVFSPCPAVPAAPEAPPPLERACGAVGGSGAFLVGPRAPGALATPASVPGALGLRPPRTEFVRLESRVAPQGTRRWALYVCHPEEDSGPSCRLRTGVAHPRGREARGRWEVGFGARRRGGGGAEGRVGFGRSGGGFCEPVATKKKYDFSAVVGSLSSPTALQQQQPE